MSKIEKALVAATKITPQKEGEDRQKFLSRLVRAVVDLEERDWKKLTDEAQAWTNSAGEALNDEKPLPEFPDAEEEEAEEEEEEAEEEEEEEAEEEEEEDEEEEEAEEKKPKAKAEKAKPAKEDKKAKAKPAKEEKAPKASKEAKPAKEEKKAKAEKATDDKPAKKEKKAGKGSGVNWLRRQICAHIDWDRAKLKAALEKAGQAIGESTLNQVYYTTHSVITMLKEAGQLK